MGRARFLLYEIWEEGEKSTTAWIWVFDAATLVRGLPPQPGEFINPAVPINTLFVLYSRTCSEAIFPKITFSIPFSPFHLVKINHPNVLTAHYLI